MLTTSRAAMSLLFCLTLMAPPFARSNTFTNFNIPGAGTGVGVPAAVNKWGTVVGSYSVSNGNNSFLWKTSGSITTIVFPKMLITIATGINKSGAVVGYYQSRSGATLHGFLRSPKYTTLDAPWAGTGGDQGTEPLSINDAGEVAGVYWDSNSIEHGFVLDTLGNYTSFDIPGGDDGVISAFLNQDGEIAGSYTSGFPATMTHGYTRDTSGNITSFDPIDSTDTFVSGINSTGVISGYYAAANATSGFVRDSSGNITSFTVPGLLAASGIADNGNIYGLEQTGSTLRGWKYTAAGVLSYFKDPAAGSQGTLPECVSGSDKATGIYYDSQGSAHDFEMTE